MASKTKAVRKADQASPPQPGGVAAPETASATPAARAQRPSALVDNYSALCQIQLHSIVF